MENSLLCIEYLKETYKHKNISLINKKNFGLKSFNGFTRQTICFLLFIYSKSKNSRSVGIFHVSSAQCIMNI